MNITRVFFTLFQLELYSSDAKHIGSVRSVYLCQSSPRKTALCFSAVLLLWTLFIHTQWGGRGSQSASLWENAFVRLAFIEILYDWMNMDLHSCFQFLQKTMELSAKFSSFTSIEVDMERKLFFSIHPVYKWWPIFWFAHRNGLELNSNVVYNWNYHFKLPFDQFSFFFFLVAMESTTILGAILGLVVLILVFLLYVNRRWCFHTTPAFACCDENSLPSKYVHKMGKSFDKLVMMSAKILWKFIHYAPRNLETFWDLKLKLKLLKYLWEVQTP